MGIRVLRAAGAVVLTSGVLAAAPAAASAAPAAVVTVPCSTSDLITAIDAAASGDTLVLASHCAYVLTAPSSTLDGDNGLPVIDRSLTLTGNDTVIERSSSAVDSFRIIEAAESPGSGLTLQGITLRNGLASGGKNPSAHDGGCILAMSDGAASPAVPTVTLTNSTIEGCRATHTRGSIGGGGIAVESGATARIVSSRLTGNLADDGAAISLDSGASATVTGTALKGNNADIAGGGAYLRPAAVLVMTGGSMSGNTAYRGGAVFSLGTGKVSGTSVAGNRAAENGGGILNAGQFFVGAALMTGNRAAGSGGAIYAFDGASTRIAASTLQLNSALVAGGAIANFGHALMVNSFVTQNSAPAGGGIYEGLPGAFAVLNSLIFGNSLNNCRPLGSVPFCVN